MTTKLQEKYVDLLHEHAMDKEVICILLEALGGEYVLGDTTEIIECTSNREFVTTHELGVGRKMTLLYRPRKVGFIVSVGPEEDDIPQAMESTIDIQKLRLRGGGGRE